MSNSGSEQHTGGCTCGHVQYQVSGKPLIVHCCHCSYCQTQSGAAFAVNALFEREAIKVTRGEVEEVQTPSPSGKGQTIARCPKCRVAVWSNYFMGGLQDRIRFLRVGTLEHPEVFPPDVHIYTETKLPWLRLPEEHQVVDEFYDIKTTWSKENLVKLAKMKEEII